ncbi:hypothetical protein [Helicobacter vulpis]|uniref:hypothetical protein n=1 Tax=Helicobacter vulpis TaxID=2316076 RepID=UPI000EAEC8F1|nr:hypothetical protein [Helicobacter vulpis]
MQEKQALLEATTELTEVDVQEPLSLLPKELETLLAQAHQKGFQEGYNAGLGRSHRVKEGKEPTRLYSPEELAAIF